MSASIDVMVHVLDLTARVVPLQLFTGRFLWWAVVFAGLAILAAVAGLRGIAGISMSIARLFVLIFLVLFVVSLIL